MPPKKQEEELTAPLIVWNVIPVGNSSLAFQSLKKSVNLKKNLDRAKLIDLLKEKGIEKYLVEGRLNREGELLICQNLQQVSQEFMTQIKKPADAKKQQKSKCILRQRTVRKIARRKKCRLSSRKHSNLTFKRLSLISSLCQSCLLTKKPQKLQLQMASGLMLWCAYNRKLKRALSFQITHCLIKSVLLMTS